MEDRAVLERRAVEEGFVQEVLNVDYEKNVLREIENGVRGICGVLMTVLFRIVKEKGLVRKEAISSWYAD